MSRLAADTKLRRDSDAGATSRGSAASASARQRDTTSYSAKVLALHSSRLPLPQRQDHPIHQAMGPDPKQIALADDDFPDTFHAWTDPFQGALQASFDAKNVTSFLDRRNRHDLFDREIHALADDSGERQFSALA